MKKTNRILSLVLCVLMLASLLPAQAFADTADGTDFSTAEELSEAEPEAVTPEAPAEDAGETPDAVAEEPDAQLPEDTQTVTGEASLAAGSSCGENLTWTLADGVLTISGTGDMYDLRNGRPWDSDVSSITSVVIENGVTSVGNYAFQHCETLKSVSFGGSRAVVSVIGEAAFEGCTALESLTLPDSVRTIKANAFHNCTALRTADLGSGVTVIGDNAFYGCKALESADLGDAVTGIGYWAFYDCTSLNSLTVPDTITTIGRDAFMNCPGVQYGSCGASASYYLFSSAKLYIVGKGAMNDFTDGAPWASATSTLTTVIIGDAITGIGANAFTGCSSLSDVTLPDGITAIGTDAFKDCPCVRVSGSCGAGEADSVNYWLFTTGQMFILGSGCMASYKSQSPWYYSSVYISTVIIGEGVNSIGEYAFFQCTNMKSVIIPDSVTAIGQAAFGHCEALTGVSIPDGVTVIEKNTFNNCTELQDVTFGSKTTSIGDGAFLFCNKLDTVVLPDSIKTIGADAFNGCPVSNLTIPNTVTSIGTYAFDACNCTLSHGDCGDDGYGSYSYVHYWLFTTGQMFILGRSGMQDYGGNPPWLADYREKITTAVIGSGVSNITGYCFEDCVNLTSVTISDSVEEIGEGAFYGCSQLTGVSIPDHVTVIGDFAFNSCTALETVKLGSSVTTIGSAAFQECKKLENVNIPDSLEKIGVYAFEYCDALSSLTLGRGVKYIGNDAFAYSGLKSITFLRSTAPDSLGSNMFLKDDSVDAYISSDNTWSGKMLDYGGTNVTWHQFQPGDVTQDGSVNLLDLLVLKQALADGTAASLKTPGSDVNGDYSVNLADLLTLKQKLVQGV